MSFLTARGVQNVEIVWKFDVRELLVGMVGNCYSTFFSALISLPKLTELYLESCELCDRIDSSVEVQFLKSITLRGIHCSGLVRSMRYDPDSNRR